MIGGIWEPIALLVALGDVLSAIYAHTFPRGPEQDNCSVRPSKEISEYAKLHRYNPLALPKQLPWNSKGELDAARTHADWYRAEWQKLDREVRRLRREMRNST